MGERNVNRSSALRRACIAATGIALIAGALCGAQASIAGTLETNMLDNESMDKTVQYAESYFSASDNSLMGVHRELGYTCVACHPTSDGSDPTSIESTSGTRTTCMTSGCHDDWDTIVEATSDYAGTVAVYNKTGIYNPHENHRSPADCGECHKAHSPQVMTCAECHNVEVPEGWEGYY